MEGTKRQFSFDLYAKPTLVIIDWFNIWNKYNNIDLQTFFDYLKKYPEIYQIRFYNGLIEGKDWSQKILDDANSIGYEVVTKKSKLQPIDIREANHFESILKSLDIVFEDIKSTNSDISNTLYNHKDLIDSTKFDLFSGVDSKLKSVDQNITNFKEEAQKPILKRKCDFDAEIARDLILEIDKYENLILFSGDGDFASTVKYLIEKRQKRIFVIYPDGSFGESDYIDNGLIEKNEIVINNKNRFKYRKNFIPHRIPHLLQHIIKKEPADCSAGPDIESVANPSLEVK